MKVCNDVLDCVGNTPIIKLSKIPPSNIKPEIWAKLEFLNPTGSIKDRIAIYMITRAMERGDLKKGMTIVVPTTGNTGISFSAVAGALGFKVLIVIPEEMSFERFALMKLLGAEFYFTPGGEADSGLTLDAAKKLVSDNPNRYYLFDQWSDETNVEAHYETTGREILDQIGCPKAFIVQIGTGGTLVGIAKRLKEECNDVLVFGAEPAECPVASVWFKTGIPGQSGRHEIEGVGDGFIPNIVIRHRHLIDGFITVSSEEAITAARMAARLEGLLVGISSGANIASAVKLARDEKLSVGDVVITVLPDSAMRYFTTRLFKKTRETTSRRKLLDELDV
ncbi:MAG: cysteine synthase family protein [Desulfurococcaceae archaeon]